MEKEKTNQEWKPSMISRIRRRISLYQRRILFRILCLFPDELLYIHLWKKNPNQCIALGPYDTATIHIQLDDPDASAYDVEVGSYSIIACEFGYKRL